MKTIRLITMFVLFSSVVCAQHDTEIIQFDNVLNQFHNVRDFCMSKDGAEAFFTIQSPSGEISQIAFMKKENNLWQEPELLPFCDSYMYLEPFLSASGNRLFFASDRPLDPTSHLKKDFDIWYVDRVDRHSNWSEPQNLGQPVNSEFDEFYPSVSENNNLYFTMDAPNGLGKDDIYVSRYEQGTYQKPEVLNENINTSGYEFNAFISKNEDFILFTKYNEKDGQGSGDLYISKKDDNGNWAKATNLGIPINTKYMEYCPFYDEANEMLYFTSKRMDINPKGFENILEFTSYIKGGANGLSKIYKTPLKLK